MAYLVQKTNMFKQKMKIDDKITGRKLHTEPAEDSCTGLQWLGSRLRNLWFIAIGKLSLVNWKVLREG